MAKLRNPRAEHLTPQRLAALISCVPDDTWDEPDMALALKLEGIAHTRYLRSTLNLPPVPEQPRTGDVVVAAAPDGQVIGRVYARQIGGNHRHQIWLWRRFPAGASEEAVQISAAETRTAKLAPGVILRVAGEREAAAPVRPTRALIPTLPTATALREQRAAVVAQADLAIRKLDAQIEAALALEAAEAARVEAEAMARRAREHAMALARGAAST